jgi:hypothetical protein
MMEKRTWGMKIKNTPEKKDTYIENNIRGEKKNIHDEKKNIYDGPLIFLLG